MAFASEAVSAVGGIGERLALENRRFLIRAELDAAFFHLYLPADSNGDWVPARKANGCPYD